MKTSDGEDIETTMFHPFYVRHSDKESDGSVYDGEWKAASNLLAGDVLQKIDGSTVYVTEVTVEKLPEIINVYNLEIEDLHTYYVADGVLVHNQYENGNESGGTTEYVEIEGRGSTGRVEPKDLIEEMTMDSTKRNPFDPGEGNTIRKVINSLNDERWKGWEKWEVVYRTASGRTITIHFSYDSINNLFDDFKFKN